MVPVTHVFIDTNVAMHYQRPDQIDWKKLTGWDSVVLVAAPVLLSELERQKIHNPSRKLKERADAFIRWLVTFVHDPSIEVRPGVFWYFIGHEPMIDFASARLSRDVADDQLIASVLDYKPEDGGSVCVATGDIGLEVKLRHRKINSISLPDDLRLPSEPDAQEKELQKLRRQAAQRRAPALVLRWQGGAAHYKIAALKVVTHPSAKSIDEIRSELPLLVKRDEKPVQGSSSSPDIARISAHLKSRFLAPDYIDRYNEELKTFFSAYETYLDQLLRWETARSLMVPLRLILSNRGNAPASQIDVMLTFPDDILLLESDSLQRIAEPEPPKPPRKPATGLGELMSSSSRLHETLAHSFLPHFQPAALARDGDPNVDSGHKVGFSISTLKHSFDFTLEGVHFRFPSRQAARSYPVQYHVSAAELPEAITGSLHIVLDDAERISGATP
jgi:hypothetical protein